MNYLLKYNKIKRYDTGGSIADYLNSFKADSSFENRQRLVESVGITNYPRIPVQVLPNATIQTPRPVVPEVITNRVVPLDNEGRYYSVDGKPTWNSNYSRSNGVIRGLIDGEVKRWDRRERMRPVLEKIGWQTKSRDPGMLQGLVKTVGASGAAAVGAAYAPWAMAAYGASQIPTSTEFAIEQMNDPNSTTFNKVSSFAPLVLNAAATVTGVRAMPRYMSNIKTAGTNASLGQTKVYDPYINASSKNVSGNAVRQTWGKAQGNSKSTYRDNHKSVSRQAEQRPWMLRNQASSTKVGGSGVSPQPLQSSRVVTPPVPVPQHAPYKQPTPYWNPVAPISQVEVPKTSWGSPDFQREYAKAKAAGISEFIYKGTPIKVQSGEGNKTIIRHVVDDALPTGPVGNYNKRVNWIPDSTSVRPARPGDVTTPHAKQLNYGRTGLSRQEQIDLQNLIRK